MVEILSVEALILYIDLYKKNPEKTRKAFEGMPYFIYDSEDEFEYDEFYDNAYSSFGKIVACFGRFKILDIEEGKEEDDNEIELKGNLYVPEVLKIIELLKEAKDWSIREAERFYKLLKEAYNKLKYFCWSDCYSIKAYTPENVDFINCELPASCDIVEISILRNTYFYVDSYFYYLLSLKDFKKYLKKVVRYGNRISKKYKLI